MTLGVLLGKAPATGIGTLCVGRQGATNKASSAGVLVIRTEQQYLGKIDR
jgi:hypothetical protein